LEPNYKSGTNKRNATGYKINGVKAINDGRIIVRPEECSIYRVFSAAEIGIDIRSEDKFTFRGFGLIDDDEFFVESTEEGHIIVGPYKAKYLGDDESGTPEFESESFVRNNDYLLSGYSYNGCTKFHFMMNGEDLVFMSPNNGSTRRYVDVISDAQLITNVKQILRDNILDNGHLDLNNIDQLVDVMQQSLVFNDIKPEIIEQRIERIKKIFNGFSSLDQSLNMLTGELGDVFGSLIRAHNGSQEAEKLINAIIENNPSIMENLPSYKIAQERLLEKEKEEKLLDTKIAESKASLKALDEKKVSASMEKASAKINSDINEKKKTIQQLNKEIEGRKADIQNLDSFSELSDAVEEKKKEKSSLENYNIQLRNTTQELEGAFVSALNDLDKKLSNYTIDGFIASNLQESASKWEQNQRMKKYDDAISFYDKLEVKEKSKEELFDYICRTIGSVRPQYGNNMIINIVLTVCQNFLTVFSGEPGGGKTSICNIIAQALGINNYTANDGEEFLDRYISVSVERGWTSKRDFIGYYNPLTKTFDQNNKEVFDGLQILNLEERKHSSRFPMLILLDEANLSPMEYYWADFMNVCDDLSMNNEINVGGEFVFKIPKTLHFMATINNDHTTETLSPRLIDRAAVIALPRVRNIESGISRINPDIIEHITWKSIEDTFIPSEAKLEMYKLQNEAGRIFDGVRNEFFENQIIISPRVELAIRKYCAAGSELFRSEDDSMRRSPVIIALDYAIAQEILPKINGYGDQFGKWLDHLQLLFSKNSLVYSSEIVKKIIEKGKYDNMNDYQFFA
jgi:tetratricopeptide (TPR) repeat protein